MVPLIVDWNTRMSASQRIAWIQGWNDIATAPIKRGSTTMLPERTYAEQWDQMHYEAGRIAAVSYEIFHRRRAKPVYPLPVKPTADMLQGFQAAINLEAFPTGWVERV